MSVDRMADLEIERLADGFFELRQQDGSLDEPCRILLHPVQVRLLAECAGLLPLPDPALAHMSAAHIRRLRALQDRIEWLFGSYHDDILRHSSGLEINLHLGAISDLADELVDDIGTAPPAAPVTEKSNENAAAFSVTPTKRGRPAAEGALTNAERQARHRARQADLLPTGERSEVQPC